MPRSPGAERLRDDLRREVAEMSFEQRVLLCLELGDQDVAFRAAALGIDEESARDDLRRRAEAARRRYRCRASR